MLILILIPLALYLLIGFIYAVYILLYGYDGWLAFPVNMLLGPIFAVYLFYITKKNKKLPL